MTMKPEALSRYPGLSARPETDNSGGMKPPPDPHYRHRFPAEIISHAVWLYHVFSLSLRDIELLLCGFRRSRPGIPSIFRAPFRSEAAHHSNLMAPRVVSSRRSVSSCHGGGAGVKR